MSADTAIKAEKVTAAAKSSATFNAPRIYRASAGAAMMRACSDAMPSRPRRALQRRALWPSRCARRGPCDVARAFRVARNEHTCSTGKVIAVSTFQDSEFPRHKKKKGAVPVRKNTGGNSYQFPRTGSGHPDSRFHASPRILENWTVSKNRRGPSRIQIPRLAADFGAWTDFKIQISPCRIQLTHLALRFGN